jgi:hypothetical protein
VGFPSFPRFLYLGLSISINDIRKIEDMEVKHGCDYSRNYDYGNQDASAHGQ